MHRFALLLAAAGVLVACGDDVSAPGSPITSPVVTSPVTTSPVTTSPVVTSPVVAVWPAADVVLDSPEAAAEDFIAQVFGVEPAIGPFQPGDAGSGEIEVLTQLDDADPTTTRPAGVTLQLQMLGPDGGWFVIGAVSVGVTIDRPTAGATVPARTIEVEGLGRGFESTVIVSAVVAGQPNPLDDEIVMTDWEVPTPYATTLDLSAAESGDIVAIIVRGDVGLEATGEFTAVPVLIG